MWTPLILRGARDFSRLEQLLEAAQIFADGLRWLAAEQHGGERSGPSPGRGVLDVNGQLSAPSRANDVEVDRPGADHIGARKRAPRDQPVRYVVDDFRVPLDGNAGRASSYPVRSPSIE